MERVSILGSGMAGWGAAYRLHQEGYPPSPTTRMIITAAIRLRGSSIPALFSTRDRTSPLPSTSTLQKLFAQSVDEKYEVIQATPNNVWKGIRIKHPAICNLHGLPHGPENEMSAGFHRGPECSGSGRRKAVR